MCAAFALGWWGLNALYRFEPVAGALVLCVASLFPGYVVLFSLPVCFRDYGVSASMCTDLKLSLTVGCTSRHSFV